MSQAAVIEANLRLKRWLKATEGMLDEHGKALVVDPGKPEVVHSELWPLSSRWRVYERTKWSLDGTADGEQVEAEACVASASSATEVMQKYSLWARDAKRHAVMRERHMRGEAMRPPVDPPEWAQERAARQAAAAEAGERTAEWNKKLARGWMKHAGMDDAVQFERAWGELKARGLVR